MASGYQSAGTDLDTLFATHVTNNAAYITGYQVSGTDIQSRYDVISNPSNANAGAHIPATGLITNITGWASNTDLASIFCGNGSQYNLTTPGSGTGSHAGFTSPITLTHTLNVTFANALALTNYFYYGGRIIIAPSQSTGTTADIDLAALLSGVGSIIIHYNGHYQVGSIGTIANATIGGANIGTTVTSLFSATEPTLYTSNNYSITMGANAAIGSASALQITTSMVIATHGSVSDTYSGTYTNTITQRNHPTQTIPTFSHTGP
jgi:hypothetical protein